MKLRHRRHSGYKTLKDWMLEGYSIRFFDEHGVLGFESR